MSISKFVDFNFICPSCGNEINLGEIVKVKQKNNIGSLDFISHEYLCRCPVCMREIYFYGKSLSALALLVIFFSGYVVFQFGLEVILNYVHVYSHNIFLIVGTFFLFFFSILAVIVFLSLIVIKKFIKIKLNKWVKGAGGIKK